MRWKECAIVDDNKFDRLICNKILQKINPNIKVHEFQTGKEILEYLQEQDEPFSTPMLILLDLNMPEMNGYEFLEVIAVNEELSSRLKDVRIAIITSSTRHEDRERAMSFPYVVGYLQKPILVGQLQELLEESSRVEKG